MRFDKKRSHSDHNHKVHMMGRGARMFAKGLMRGEGRGGPFGRFGRGFGANFESGGFDGEGRGAEVVACSARVNCACCC